MTTSFSSFLDIVRALAAIAVFLNHLRSPLFPGYPNLPPDEQNIVTRGWFFITGFGFEAVMVFFVLSGFLVGGLGIEKIRKGTFNFERYTIDRLSRLFIVLIPALCITILLDYLGNFLFPSQGIWTGSNAVFSGNGYSVSFIERDTFAIFFCNLMMLQSFYCPVLGSNIPLWTLSYEFWFYAVFGLSALSFATPRTRKARIVVVAILILALLGSKFVWMLAVWLFGVAAYAIDRPNLRRPVLSIGVFLALATISRILAVGEPRGNMLEIALIMGQGLAFSWVILSFKGCDIGILSQISKFSEKMASFSYTLYLIHFPVMLFTIALVFDVFHIKKPVSPLSPTGLAIYFGVFTAVMTLAWIIAFFTEAKTRYVRDLLTSHLHRTRAS